MRPIKPLRARARFSNQLGELLDAPANDVDQVAAPIELCPMRGLNERHYRHTEYPIAIVDFAANEALNVALVVLGQSGQLLAR